LEGDWWQLSLTARTELEPSAVSLLTISRVRAGALEVSAGRRHAVRALVERAVVCVLLGGLEDCLGWQAGQAAGGVF
jgi:hypothetical protein